MGRNKLEDYIMTGIHGVKELGKEQKKLFLGQFRERVLKVILEEQVSDIRYLDAMIKSMEDLRAKKLLLRGDLSMELGDPLINEAGERNIDFTFIDESMVEGPIIVALASDIAVNQENIQLTISDLPKDFYIHKGKKICKECYEYIHENYGREKDLFQKMGIIDYLTGVKCPIESRHN